jgi:glycosyltransferase involved in cell wall biosynthesis
MLSRASPGRPSVSVIIPAHNAAGYLGRAIESVRAQSFADFEVIVVDDGSTDQTSEVAHRCAAEDGRIRALQQSRAGVAAARNRALAEARAPYVANIDADDVWRPGFLERTVAALESDGAAAPFAFARSLWIDPDDRVLDQAPIPLPAEVDYRELLLRNPVGNGSATLMRTRAVRDSGGYDEAHVARFRQGEDWLLQLRLSWQGPARVVDEPLVLYRIWPSSASHAVKTAVAGSLEVIRRCRREGPRLDRSVYRAAASLTLLWHARRAWSLRDRRLALHLLLRAYGGNPTWFRLPELREPVRTLPGKLSRVVAFRGTPDLVRH